MHPARILICFGLLVTMFGVVFHPLAADIPDPHASGDVGCKSIRCSLWAVRPPSKTLNLQPTWSGDLVPYWTKPNTFASRMQSIISLAETCRLQSLFD